MNDAVLDAALTLLNEGGYAGLTVDALAAAAGVAKTTIYRRWPSKELVVVAAVERLALGEAAEPDTGSLRDDLRALLRPSIDLMVEGPGRVLETLVRESGRNEEVARIVRTVIHERRRAFFRVLNRAVARGELAPTVDQELLIDLLVGTVWTRLLVTGAPVSAAIVDDLLDLVLPGVAQPARG